MKKCWTFCTASNRTTCTVLAKPGMRGTKNCATPMMFLFMPKNAERNSPDSARKSHGAKSERAKSAFLLGITAKW